MRRRPLYSIGPINLDFGSGRQGSPEYSYQVPIKKKYIVIRQEIA